jgi:hypothetical protein
MLPTMLDFRWCPRRLLSGLLVLVAIVLSPPPALAQIKAAARAGATPPWTKGILPISSESYYHAIECGKQGGDDPACVFWDTGLCKNDDFTLAFYTPYKQVAYAVWQAVRKKLPAPTPSYGAAQQARITVGVTAVPGSKNAFTDLAVRRGGKAVPPRERSVGGGSGRFSFDFPAFAASAPVTLELVGKERTLSCTLSPAVLRSFR